MGVKIRAAKKVSLVIFKASIDASSMLDAYVKILNDLRRRRMEGETLAGYNILNLSSTIRLENGEAGYIKTKIAFLISRMVRFGLVFLCAVPSGPRDIDQHDYPSSLAANLPIIVIGATDRNDGKTFSWSSGG